MRISDWSSDVCSSDLAGDPVRALADQRRRALQHPPTLVRPDAPPMAESPLRRVERAIEIVVGRMRHLGVHRSIGGIQYRFAVARAAGDPFAVDEQRGLRLITFSHRVLPPSVSSPSSPPAPPLPSIGIASGRDRVCQYVYIMVGAVS